MSTETPPQAPDNVDVAEVDQFDRQAGKWWDVSGPFRMLHRIGPVRLQYIKKAVTGQFGLEPTARTALTGLTCLDVGCGGGLISEPLRRLGADVTGIDPAENNIAAATAHARAGNLDIDYRCSTAEDLQAEGATFDAVICLEVIEHVPDPAAFIQTLRSLVKPGGILVMSTLNRTAKSFALAIVGAEYVLRWLPTGTHDWNRFVRPDELKDYLETAGLTNFSAEGLVYSPLSDTWRLSDDTGVNYLAHAAAPR